MYRKLSILAAVLILIPIVAACSSGATVTVTKAVTVYSTSTVVPTVTSTITAITIAPAPTVTGIPTTTAGDLAAFGDSKFETNCTYTYCHASFGPNGPSGSLNGIPAEVEFAKLPLSYFGDAESLFIFIKSFMHHPDTVSFLNDDDYVQIMAFLLTQNGTLKSTDKFGLSNLSTVILSR